MTRLSNISFIDLHNIAAVGPLCHPSRVYPRWTSLVSKSDISDFKRERAWVAVYCESVIPHPDRIWRCDPTSSTRGEVDELICRSASHHALPPYLYLAPLHLLPV